MEWLWIENCQKIVAHAIPLGFNLAGIAKGVALNGVLPDIDGGYDPSTFIYALPKGL